MDETGRGAMKSAYDKFIDHIRDCEKENQTIVEICLQYVRMSFMNTANKCNHKGDKDIGYQYLRKQGEIEDIQAVVDYDYLEEGYR